jgi:hypothetical protein
MIKEELYYQVARSRFGDQLSRKQLFEIKATAVIGFSAALFAIAAFALGRSDIGRLVSLFLASLLVVSFLVTGGLALRILWEQRWRSGPNLSQLAIHLPEYDEARLAKWVANAFSNAVEHNETLLKEKADLLQVSMIGLMVEASILGIAGLAVALY